jgi:hypothetical protein
MFFLVFGFVVFRISTCGFLDGSTMFIVCSG